MKKQIVAVVTALALVLTMIPAFAFAAGSSSDKVSVSFTAGVPGGFDMVDESLDVSGDLAEKYFPEIEANEPAGVSFADALVAAHIKKYGENSVKDKLDISNGDWGTQMNKQFGRDIVGMYYVNGVSLPGSVSDAIANGDELYAGAFADFNYSDLYTYFEKKKLSTKVGKTETLSVTADNWGSSVIPKSGDIYTVDQSSGKLQKKAGSIKSGKATLKFDKAGTFYITAKAELEYEGWGGTVKGSAEGALCKVTVTNVVPAAPKIKATLTSNKAAKVTWGAVKDAKAYKVMYKANGAKNWTTKESKKTSLNITGLKPGKTYQIKAAAVGSPEKSKDSNIVKVVTLAKVKGLKVKKNGIKYTLSWKKAATAKGYEKMVFTSTTKKWNTVKRGKKIGATKFRTIKFFPSKQYRYKVRAYKTVNGKKIYGPWSNAVKAK